MFGLTDATYIGLKKELSVIVQVSKNSTILETVTVICAAIQLITFYLEDFAAHRGPNNNSNNKL